MWPLNSSSMFWWIFNKTLVLDYLLGALHYNGWTTCTLSFLLNQQLYDTANYNRMSKIRLLRAMQLRCAALVQMEVQMTFIVKIVEIRTKPAAHPLQTYNNYNNNRCHFNSHSVRTMSVLITCMYIHFWPKADCNRITMPIGACRR